MGFGQPCRRATAPAEEISSLVSSSSMVGSSSHTSAATTVCSSALVPSPTLVPSTRLAGSISSSALSPSAVSSRRLSADDDYEVLVRELWESHLLELDPQVAATKRWRSGYWKKWHESILLTCDDVESRDFVEKLSPGGPALGGEVRDEVRDESDQDRRQVTEEAQLAETHPEY